MRTRGHFIAILAGTSLLSACGGGGTTVSRAGNAAADQVLAKTTPVAAQALADGTTLRASERASSGVARNFDDATAAVPQDTTARVTRNASGALTLQVGGETIAFAPGDLTGDGYGYDTGTAGIWAWNEDSMAEALDPANGRNSLVFDYYADLPGNKGQSGFVVVGSETDAADLAALPSATYSGGTRVRVAPTAGFENYDDAVSEARGDLTMAANFGAGTISGSVTNMEGRAPRNVDPTRTWSALDGTLALNSTGITGNGFAGTVSADSAFTTEVGTVGAGSSYAGTFFGTAANEVAGGVSLTGTSAEDGTPYVGWGFIQGYKD